IEPVVLESGLVRYGWPSPDPNLSFLHEAVPETLALTAVGDGEWLLLAATLVNEESPGWLPVTVGNYRLIHSGDVKIYENLDVLPRALLINEWQWAADMQTSAEMMAADGFNVRETAVLIQPPDLFLPQPAVAADQAGQAEIVLYRPEEVIVRTDSTDDSFLLLTDAYYPGWEVTIDDEPGRIFQADGMFRAVFVPVGSHEVVFAYKGVSYTIGRLISLVGLLIWLVLGVSLFGLERLRMVRM
ncbi:MAG: YfhO family protein, partial [Anaerolineales bacterium]|nr:YfhO family protein [Anaerolineales bacterium]